LQGSPALPEEEGKRIKNAMTHMQTNTKLLIASLLLSATLGNMAGTAPAAQPATFKPSGETLFDKETFGGNGRSCATCHTATTGTFSIEEAQARFLKDPNDPLFRQPDSDNLGGQTYNRLLATGTIKIDVPLASNVRLLDDPAARTVKVFRATPTVKNVTTLVPFLMADGRESSSDLQHQALSAIHQHTQNTVEPTQSQLDAIAAFERSDERFFSSKALQQFANGGPPPKLPKGSTPSERRGREFFNPNRQCGICHSGPMLDTSSDFDFLRAPGSHFHFVGAGFQLGPVDQAFEPDGSLVMEPGNPNPNRPFEFTMPDGSKNVIIAPDLGRALITGDPDNDEYVFKIPTLWGIKDTTPYFHDNSARTLEDVMDHYNRLFQFIDSQFPPDQQFFGQMSDQDIADIVAFLKLL
jgi:cytochrome c peroxidase